MGQDQVIFSDVFVVILNVVFELRTVLSEVIARLRHCHQADVQEVGSPAHHSETGLRPVGHHPMPMFQIADGFWDDERRSDTLAGRRRNIGHIIPKLGVVLHVVELRHCRNAVA